jgi:VanZ family protein
MAGFMRWLWIWGPAAAMMTAIFLASSIPDLTELPAGISDRTGHLIGYGLLGGLTLRAMAEARWDRVAPRTAAAAWLFSALYALTDEFHQRFVHGRSPDVGDWVVDIIGAGVVVVAVALVARLIRTRREKTRAV